MISLQSNLKHTTDAFHARSYFITTTGDVSEGGAASYRPSAVPFCSKINTTMKFHASKQFFNHAHVILGNAISQDRREGKSRDCISLSTNSCHLYFMHMTGIKQCFVVCSACYPIS